MPAIKKLHRTGVILFDERHQLLAVAVIRFWRPKRTGLPDWKVRVDRLESDTLPLERVPLDVRLVRPNANTEA